MVEILETVEKVQKEGIGVDNGERYKLYYLLFLLLMIL